MEFKKRGSLCIPNEIVNISCVSKVLKPIYTYNQKKYIDLELPIEVVRRVEQVHEKSASQLNKENKVNPLHCEKLKVKVPFKYNKVTCKMPGKLIYEALQGDRVKVNLEYCGVWSVGEYCGHSWKLTMFNL